MKLKEEKRKYKASTINQKAYILNTYYICMKKILIKAQKELRIKNIAGFFKKIVNSYGTGAKIDCPKIYLGKKVYVVILEDERD